jgi:hypothetical protein
VRAIVGTRDPSGKGDSLHIDPRLKDIADKLQKLGYQRYRLMSARRDIVPVAGRHSMSFSNGQKLTLRPLYVKEQRVGMWMKWIDSKGMEIIDTRMHYTCGEDALTALETNAATGLILSIRVDPIR